MPKGQCKAAVVWTDFSSPSLCAGAEVRRLSEAILFCRTAHNLSSRRPTRLSLQENDWTRQEAEWERQKAEWTRQEASLRQQVQHAGSLQQEKQHLQQEKQLIQQENEQLQQEISRLKRYIPLLSSWHSNPLQHPTATGTQSRCSMCEKK